MTTQPDPADRWEDPDAALARLLDQAIHTAGDEGGRERAVADHAVIAAALSDTTGGRRVARLHESYSSQIRLAFEGEATALAENAELRERAEQAERQVRELERWKAEGMVVLAEWDRVWEALGRPGRLGESKALSVLAALSGVSGPTGFVRRAGQRTDPSRGGGRATGSPTPRRKGRANE